MFFPGIAFSGAVFLFDFNRVSIFRGTLTMGSSLEELEDELLEELDDELEDVELLEEEEEVLLEDEEEDELLEEELLAYFSLNPLPLKKFKNFCIQEGVELCADIRQFSIN